MSREDVERVLRGVDAFNRRVTRATGRGKDSGVPVEGIFPHLYELRDGQVVGVKLYGDRAAALEELGLED